MIQRPSRAALRRDADHQFIPCAARVSPRTCQVCGQDGHCLFAGTDREEWHHGSKAGGVIPHPEANVLFDSGHARHYPSPRHQGATLCGRAWAGRGRQLRLSDGMVGSVCADCLVELEKRASCV